MVQRSATKVGVKVKVKEREVGRSRRFMAARGSLLSELVWGGTRWVGCCSWVGEADPSSYGGF